MSTDPEHNLTPAEIESRDRLEAIAQHGLGAYVQVGNALAEIRDRHLYRDGHSSFETYVRERWGVNIANGDPLSQTSIHTNAPARSLSESEPRVSLSDKPCEAVARACEETLAALAGVGQMSVEIRFAIRRQGDPGMAADGESVDSWTGPRSVGDELVPTLRWLLTQASGTIGEVANELESRAADIDDVAREQLRDDVIVLDGELAVVKALLEELIDWDSELRRLLTDEPPRRDTDTDPGEGDA